MGAYMTKTNRLVHRHTGYAILGVRMERVASRLIFLAPGGEMTSMIGFTQDFEGNLSCPRPRPWYERLLRWVLRYS